MLRELGIFERALVLSDLHTPFNVVSVLRLENAPAPEAVQKALHALQERHPLLQAGIKNGAFEKSFDQNFLLTFIAAQHEQQWLEIVEREMNTRLHPPSGLFRCTYLGSPSQADLILTFHHAIMDAASGMNLLDELLRVCADEEMQPLPTLEVVPPVEERFPPSFKGLRGAVHMLRYASAQMTEEIQYQLRMRGKRKPAIHLGGQGYPLTLLLAESVVDQLSKRCRAEHITMNSLLNASLLLTVNRLIYAGESRFMQTVSFADLRPYTHPPTPPENLANYISMLRYTLLVPEQVSIWSLAKDLHQKIYRSLKQGNKFTASRMSEALMKMLIQMKTMRMGASALNYSGAVPLEKKYGNIKVNGLHAFLSSFDLGPEVSAQARLFNGELSIDFMFLGTDMTRDLAKKIVGEMKTLLEQAATG